MAGLATVVVVLLVAAFAQGFDLDCASCNFAFAQDQGQRGKVVDYRVPIEIEGVAIRPSDHGRPMN